MKILQVSAYSPPNIGGSERYCHELSKRLVERGHEVHLVTSKLERDSLSNETIDGIHVHRCPCIGNFWGVNPYTFIMHKLFNGRYDVIHAHSYIFLTSNQAVFSPKTSRTPVLLHLHGGINWVPSRDDSSIWLKFQAKKRLYDPTIGRLTLQAASAVASVSLSDINSARNLWHLDASKFYWVPNAVDIEKFKVNPIDIKSKRLSVIFIARLEMWKGIDTLLEVAKIVGNEMEEVDFIIIGDGSLKRYIETVKARFNKNIKVIGQVSPEFIPEMLANASVLILPSYMEGLPTVCLEALACEVPAVASNVGGVSEIIKDGETGYLFPAGDAQMCADRILKLLSDDKLRKMMGRNGRRLVKSVFTWEKVIEKTERIYEIMGDR